MQRIFPRLMLSILLFSLSGILSAQTTLPKERKSKGNNGFSSHAGASERSKVVGTTIDVNSIPIEYGRYREERYEEQKKAMQEREWGSEDTAWKRAKSLDTKDAYQKYAAMYPQGAHVAEANNRLIDLKVKDMMDGAHGSLPSMKRVFADDNSPTSDFQIENFTGYPLTVMFSGPESKSIVIREGGRTTVRLKNGAYKIAASVPKAGVRPFAGCETFRGGNYEVGFYIASVGAAQNHF